MTIDIDDFTTDQNYFNEPYIYGIHITIILSTRCISSNLLPLSFYLINKKNIIIV